MGFEFFLCLQILTSLLPLTSTIEAFRPLHHSILRSISHQAHALVLLSSSTIEESLDLSRRGSGRSCSQDHKLSLRKTAEADMASSGRPVKEPEEGGETGEMHSSMAESGASKAKGEEGQLTAKLSRKNSLTAGGVAGEEGVGGRVDVPSSSSSFSSSKSLPSSSFSSDGKSAVATPRSVCGGGTEGGGGGGAAGQGGAGGIGRPDFQQNQGQLDWLFSMSLKCFVRLAVTPQGTLCVEVKKHSACPPYMRDRKECGQCSQRGRHTLWSPVSIVSNVFEGGTYV